MSQPHDRAFNFSAGPCTLPVEVLEEAHRELLNYKGTGVSVMEMSHRSKPYEKIIAEAEADLRTLFGVPDNYKVLFMHGGATGQFSMLANSFLGEGQVGDFIVTGAWGQKAVEAARMIGTANVLWDGKEGNYNAAPTLDSITPSANSAFVHYTSNETIQGVEFFDEPGAGTWICDMSSDILSRPMDVSKYVMIYAGAQKNMGPAGVAVAIIRDDFLERAPAKTHPIWDYRLTAANGSMYNTPTCWSIYVCGLVYKYMLANGGLAGAEARNREKAKVIYDAIEASEGFFKAHAVPANRSLMNITFTLPSDELTGAFLKGAEERRMLELKGHRSVGGCRASIYNAFPLAGCQALAEFMAEFRAANA